MLLRLKYTVLFFLPIDYVIFNVVFIILCTICGLQMTLNIQSTAGAVPVPTDKGKYILFAIGYVY